MLLCAPYVNWETCSASRGGDLASSNLVRLAQGGIVVALAISAAVMVCTVLAAALGFDVDMPFVFICCASSSLSVLLLLGAFIDRVRGAYIDALPPDRRVLATVPDESEAIAKRLSTIVAPAAVVCTALIRGRFDREEMPPASV